jgi:hypothetical protein
LIRAAPLEIELGGVERGVAVPDPQEAVACFATIERVTSYDVAGGVDRTGKELDLAKRHVERRVSAPAQQEAALFAANRVHSHDLAGGVDPISLGMGRAGRVDGGKD